MSLIKSHGSLEAEIFGCGQRDTGQWKHARRDATLLTLKGEEGSYESRNVDGL